MHYDDPEQKLRGDEALPAEPEHHGSEAGQVSREVRRGAEELGQKQESLHRDGAAVQDHVEDLRVEARGEEGGGCGREEEEMIIRIIYIFDRLKRHFRYGVAPAVIGAEYLEVEAYRILADFILSAL